MPTRALRTLACVTSVLAGCADAPTQVAVHVHTNLGPGELDGVSLIVRGQEGEEDEPPVRTQEIVELDLTAGVYREIGSFGILPRGGDSRRRFEVVAVARQGGAASFSTKVISGFVRHQTIRLDLYLPRTCLALADSCHPDETCGIAGCVDPVVDAADLPRDGEGSPDQPVDPRSGFSAISPGANVDGLRVPREVRYTLASARGGTIHYTVDGSDPRPRRGTTVSAPAPVTLDPLGTATIRWFAEADDGSRESLIHRFESTLDEGLRAGDGFLVERVSFAGRGPIARVAPGERVSAELTRQVWRRPSTADSVSCAITQLHVDLDRTDRVLICLDDTPFPRWGTYPGHEAVDLAPCAGDAGSVSTGYAPDEPVTFTLDAPTEPGVHAVSAALALEFRCLDVRPDPGGLVIGHLVVP